MRSCLTRRQDGYEMTCAPTVSYTLKNHECSLQVEGKLSRMEFPSVSIFNCK